MRSASAPETGELIHQLPGNRAKVKIPRRERCSECQNYGLCVPFGSSHMVLEAMNQVGARPGQVVQVTFSPQGTLRIPLLLYLLPLAALIVGVLLGRWMDFLGSPNASSAVLSLGLIALTFSALRLYTRKISAWQPLGQPRVNKIVD